MTRTYEEYKEEVTKERLVSRMCDWCSEEMGWRYGAARECYGSRDWCLEYASGTSFPDSGHKIGWKVEDMCDDCVTKLRQMLEDAGIEITPVDMGW